MAKILRMKDLQKSPYLPELLQISLLESYPEEMEENSEKREEKKKRN